METNSYSTLLERMKTRMTTMQDKITDFNEGSVILTLFECIANVLEQAYIDTRLGFQNNLNYLAESVFGFSKKEGVNATVNVVFSRSVALESSVTIPSGTVVSDGSHNFTTSENAVIESDKLDSNSVAAQANDVGTEYNISAGEINTIVSIVSGEVTSVTNAVKASGGANEETETEMLARFKTYINGLQGSNLYGLKAGILALSEVRSVGVVEHFPPVNDYTNVTIYVDDGTGNMTDELKEKIEDLVNGDGTSTNSGLKAAGINVDIEPCTQVSVDVSADITVYRVENAVAEAALKESLENAINGLEINEDVIYAEIITALKQTGSYVKNIKNLKLNNINDDVAIAVNQLARLGNVTLTIGSES